MKLKEIIQFGFKEETRPYTGSTGKAHFHVQFENDHNGRVTLEYWNLTERVTLITEQGGDGEEGQYTSLYLQSIDTIDKLKSFIYLLTGTYFSPTAS